MHQLAISAHLLEMLFFPNMMTKGVILQRIQRNPPPFSPGIEILANIPHLPLEASLNVKLMDDGSLWS